MIIYRWEIFPYHILRAIMRYARALLLHFVPKLTQNNGVFSHVTPYINLIKVGGSKTRHPIFSANPNLDWLT